jgi:twitching motility protein PilI
MKNTLSAEDTIALLHDIERRSKQKAAGLSQQDTIENAWTAIGFRLDSFSFLTPLQQTREIFPVPTQITPVPKSRPWVFGMINLRGELLPVFDLKHYLTGQKNQVSKRSRIIVINHQNFYSGILVDEVFGLKHIPFEAETQSSITDEKITPYLDGSVNQQDTQWDVFSLLKLIADQRFENAAA